jgi:glutamine cyclotransferase
MFRNIIFSFVILFVSFFLLNNLYSSRNSNFLEKIKRNELYYTQGIFFDTENTLIESGGMWGTSVLVRMEYPSMKVIKKINLDKEYFAEGIARCGNFVYQLTWQNRKVLKYSYPELELVNTLPLDTNVKEGWGLAQYNNKLYATDGTNNIYTINCDSLKVEKKVSVFYNNQPLKMLNALDIVDGMAYTNVYFNSNIYQIELDTGNVLKVLDMANLIKAEFEAKTLTKTRLNQGEVLNGIAYRANTKDFIVTGKMWGHYYKINLK